jgi:hypothetical protein
MMRFPWKRDPLDSPASQGFQQAWTNLIKSTNKSESDRRLLPVIIRKERNGAWIWYKINCAYPECGRPVIGGICYCLEEGELLIPVFYCSVHGKYVRKKLRVE